MTFAKITSQPLLPSMVQSIISWELKRILDTAEPVVVYLFGSGARNEMTQASDLDFLIVLPDGAAVRKIKQKYYNSSQERKVAVDAIFVTESQYRQRSKIGGVCMVCHDEGIILYQTPRNVS